METFVRAATEQRRGRAERVLAARPELEHDPWVRLVLGRDWDGDPNAPGGPLGWAPLVYACHSCFETTALGRELLARGADPNAFFVNEYGEMSALYGAAGVKHDPELTRALLEAGADPDDGESLYHATEAESPECVRILLEHGARVDGTNALAHALDEDQVEHVRLMLEHGGDPNERLLVAHAVRRGRGAETIELLAANGADLDRPGGETWRGDVPLRTPYQHAFLRGKDGARRPARAARSLDRRRPRGRLGRAARARRASRRAPLPTSLRRRHAGGSDHDRAARRRRARRARRSGSASAGSSADRPRGRCSTTRAGSGRSTSSSGCSRSAPIRRRRLRPTSRRRSTGPCTPRSTTASPDRDYVGIAERLVAAGAPPVAEVPGGGRRAARRVASENEHRVAERVEAVALRDRLRVEAAASPRSRRRPSRARAGSSAAGGSSSAARRRAETRTRA